VDQKSYSTVPLYQ